MSYYAGRLKAVRLEPTAVTIEVAEGRFRVVAGKRHLGSWPMDTMEIHRTSVYRFAFEIEGDTFEFNGLRFEVVDMDGRRVDKVMVNRVTSPQSPPTAHPSPA